MAPELLTLARGGGGGDALPVLLLIPFAIIGVVVWTWRKGRARAMLDVWAATQRLRLLEVEPRTLFKGPFFLTSSRGQAIYRITVQDSQGAVRQGYARCGGWFLGLLADQVEVRWDEPDRRESAPGGFPVIL